MLGIPGGTGSEFTRALDRVGHTAESHARWLLDLYQQGDNEQCDLAWEVPIFLHHGHEGEVPLTEMDPDKARRGWEDICNRLRHLLRDKVWTHRITWEFRFKLSQGDTLHTAHRVVERDWLIHRVHTTLMGVKDRLQKCRGRWCPYFILRTGRRLYCSDKCAGKNRVQRFRQGRRKHRAGITGTGVDTQSPTE